MNKLVKSEWMAYGSNDDEGKVHHAKGGHGHGFWMGEEAVEIGWGQELVYVRGVLPVILSIDICEYGHLTDYESRDCTDDNYEYQDKVCADLHHQPTGLESYPASKGDLQTHEASRGKHVHVSLPDNFLLDLMENYHDLKDITCSIVKLEIGLEYPTEVYEDAVKLGMFFRKCFYLNNVTGDNTVICLNKHRQDKDAIHNMSGEVYKSLPVSRLPGYLLKLAIYDYKGSFASLKELDHDNAWEDCLCLKGVDIAKFGSIMAKLFNTNVSDHSGYACTLVETHFGQPIEKLSYQAFYEELPRILQNDASLVKHVLDECTVEFSEWYACLSGTIKGAIVKDVMWNVGVAIPPATTIKS